VVSLIEERLGVNLPESQITQTTTVKQLRALIKKGSAAEPEQPRPRWPYKRPARFVGNLLRETLLWALLRIWVHARVTGKEHIKNLKTPALFIFNHVDGFDAPVVFNALPRRIRNRLAVAIADDVIANHPVLHIVPRLCYGGYNFARHDPFMPTLTYTGNLVDKGWSVAIAPEGKVSLDGNLQPFKSGIGLLAVELGIPIVPIKTEGLFGTMPIANHNKFPKKRSQIRVRIGEPITFARHTPYDDAKRHLEQIMHDL